MSDLKVMSGEEMRGLRRLSQLQQIVSQIYNHTVGYARESEKTLIQIDLMQYTRHFTLLNKKENMDASIERLRDLFPGCLVEHKILSQGNDGKMHDISNLDPSMRTFIHMNRCKEYIIIDWSVDCDASALKLGDTLPTGGAAAAESDDD